MNIKNHILRFPRVESHYCRKSSTVQYLPADLNLQKMFEFFEKENPETTVKISTYRRVFKTFKLSFHKPKKDLCYFCTKYKNSTENEKTLLNDQMNEHMQNKEDSRAEKQRDKEAAEADLTLKVYTYDLQAVLSSPRAEESSFYYSRKFATYNLTLYDLATEAGFCYLWHETVNEEQTKLLVSCTKIFRIFPGMWIKSSSTLIVAEGRIGIGNYLSCLNSI